MKKHTLSLLGIIALILVSCSGSDVYRGSWKATDSQGSKFEIVFDAKNFTVKDSTGKIDKFNYSQRSVNINNGVSTYGIQLGDGRAYQIHFPIPSKPSVALLKDENGEPMFTLSRDEHIQYEELYNLK